MIFEAVLKRLLKEELKVKASVRPSQISGLGLFANEDIPAGTVVFDWNDQVDQEYSRQYPEVLSPDEKEDFTSLASTDGNSWFLAGDGGAYFNHSEDPNVEVEPGPGAAARRRRKAARDIALGEEMTMNYSDIGLDGPDEFAR